MGRFIEWLRARGIPIYGPDDHEALIQRIEGNVSAVWQEAERLDGLPTAQISEAEVSTLRDRAKKLADGLHNRLQRRSPGYHALRRIPSLARRVDEAQRLLGAAQVRIAAVSERVRGQTDIRSAIEAHEGERGRKPAEARWARLDPVKEWAFEQRRNHPEGDRAPVIRRILPEVKERAKAAGEPLTGDEPAIVRTVTGWFRKAGIE